MMALKVILLFASIAVASACDEHDLESRLIGKYWRFKSYNYPQFYIRHQNYWARISRVSYSRLYRLDSTWKVVHGLCGEGISLQSRNYPNHYLRHRNYRARIDRYSNAALFKKDACFHVTPGLANDAWLSLESVNYPGYFLRHQNYFLRISRESNNWLFKKDATFKAYRVRSYYGK